jgi:hypothetical protein
MTFTGVSVGQRASLSPTSTSGKAPNGSPACAYSTTTNRPVRRVDREVIGWSTSGGPSDRAEPIRIQRIECPGWSLRRRRREVPGWHSEFVADRRYMSVYLIETRCVRLHLTG